MQEVFFIASGHGKMSSNFFKKIKLFSLTLTQITVGTTSNFRSKGPRVPSIIELMLKSVAVTFLHSNFTYLKVFRDRGN